MPHFAAELSIIKLLDMEKQYAMRALPLILASLFVLKPFGDLHSAEQVPTPPGTLESSTVEFQHGTDPVSMTSEGQRYLNGDGVVKNEKTAFVLFQRAAEQGNEVAQYNLGVMYAEGIGTVSDDRQAVDWYRKAAEQGYSRAQNNLGAMYDTGRGIDKDPELALQWYQKAADQENPIALYNIGEMYDEGRGVAQDRAQAARWYMKAVNYGYATALHRLGSLFRDGDGVDWNPTLALAYLILAAERETKEERREVYTVDRDALSATLPPPQRTKAEELARSMAQYFPAE